MPARRSRTRAGSRHRRGRWLRGIDGWRARPRSPPPQGDREARHRRRENSVLRSGCRGSLSRGQPETGLRYGCRIVRRRRCIANPRNARSVPHPIAPETGRHAGSVVSAAFRVIRSERSFPSNTPKHRKHVAGASVEVTGASSRRCYARDECQSESRRGAPSRDPAAPT